MAFGDDWVWFKFKIKRGWQTHLIFFIKRRNECFKKHNVVVALMQALADAQFNSTADTITGLLRMALPERSKMLAAHSATDALVSGSPVAQPIVKLQIARKCNSVDKLFLHCCADSWLTV